MKIYSFDPRSLKWNDISPRLMIYDDSVQIDAMEERT